MPFSSHNTLKLRFPAEDEFLDLSGHNNHMAKVLTPELYAELRAKSTLSGFTVDDVIQNRRGQPRYARLSPEVRTGARGWAPAPPLPGSPGPRSGRPL